MVRIIVILTGLITLLSAVNAQNDCTPDEFYADSTGGVYPRPVSEAFPDAGIDLPACPGQDYYFNLTINVPDTLLFGDITVEIIRVKLRTDDPVKGLPDGLSYVCNPTNCDMPSGTLGCVAITGTVSADVTPGIYPLEILVEIVTGIGIPINTQFPNDAIAPGEYFIIVEAPNEDGECLSVSVAEIDQTDEIRIYPNPSGYEGFTIQLPRSNSGENFEVIIFDMSGQVVYHSQGHSGRELYINPLQLAGNNYIVQVRSEINVYTGQLSIVK